MSDNELLLGIFALVTALIAVTCSAIGSQSSHERRMRNAQDWTNAVGMASAKIDCDRTFGTCACTVVSGEKIRRIECCGSGCVLRPIDSE